MFANLKNMDVKKAIIVILIVAVVIYFILQMWNNYSKKMTHKRVTPDNNNVAASDDNDTNKTYKLYYFYSPNCGHCQNFKQEWKNVEKKLSSVNNLELISVDGNLDENQKLMFYFNIQGYPTLILTTPTNGKIEYTGNRNASDIETFVVSKMQN